MFSHRLYHPGICGLVLVLLLVSPTLFLTAHAQTLRPSLPTLSKQMPQAEVEEPIRLLENEKARESGPLCTARKLLHIAWAVVKKDQPFGPNYA
jgi:hypothetical protein